MVHVNESDAMCDYLKFIKLFKDFRIWILFILYLLCNIAISHAWMYWGYTNSKSNIGFWGFQLSTCGLYIFVILILFSFVTDYLMKLFSPSDDYSEIKKIIFVLNLFGIIFTLIFFIITKSILFQICCYSLSFILVLVNFCFIYTSIKPELFTVYRDDYVRFNTNTKQSKSGDKL